MTVEPASSVRVTFIAVALLLLAWGLFGFLGMGNRPYDGFDYASGFVVSDVEQGGPADQAGLRVGDQVISMGGVSMTDRSDLYRLPRAEIGESRVYNRLMHHGREKVIPRLEKLMALGAHIMTFRDFVEQNLEPATGHA